MPRSERPNLGLLVPIALATVWLAFGCSPSSDELFDYSEEATADLIVVLLPETGEPAVSEFFLGHLAAGDGTYKHAPGIRSTLRTEVSGRPAFAVNYDVGVTPKERMRLLEELRSAPLVDTVLENTSPVMAARALEESVATREVGNDRSVE